MTEQLDIGLGPKTLGEAMRTALAAARNMPSEGDLSDTLAQACEDLVAHGKETARLVALTNIAGAAAQSGVDPELLQAQAGGVDFRSLYKRTTRPFLMQIAEEAAVKWTPSADPYVSNPYREARVDAAWVARRGGKLAGAAELHLLLQAAKSDPGSAAPMLARLVACETAKLQAMAIAYRIPPRLTVPILSRLLSDWLDGGTRGARLEIAAIALLRHAGGHLGGLWRDVTSHHVNDPAPYDALCRSGDKVHLVAEVKDQPVQLQHLQNLADQMVEHGAARGLVLTRAAWMPSGEAAQVMDRYLAERTQLGLRLQILDFDAVLTAWLPLLDLDDDSLPGFVRALTQELDHHGALSDRTAFASLLKQI